MSNAKGLAALLSPRSIAIIGASDRGYHGKMVADNLSTKRFEGPVYFVNPTRKEVWGGPCYPSVLETPTVPELAILVVQRERVLGVVEQCAKAGVRSLIINTDGFSESADSRGQDLQRDLTVLVRDSGILLCGPNCLGIISFHGRVAAYCGPICQPVRPGNLSFISQSGGGSAYFMELAYSRNIGMSYVVSTGNEAELDICDYMEHVIDDPNTTAICLLMESIRNPRRFVALSTKSTQIGKPVIAIKLGRSDAARAAALAHTGALAGSDEAVATLFEQAGVIRASSLDEAIDQCSPFCLVPKQRWMRGGRIAVFTVGGGLAALISDLALDRGIELPVLPESVREVVTPEIPPTVRLQNPFDIPGAYVTERPEIARAYVRACAARPEFDAVVMLRLMPGPKSLEYLTDMNTIPSAFGKPVFVSSPIDSPMEDYKRAFMERSDLTLITGLQRLVTGMQAAVNFERAQKRGLGSLPEEAEVKALPARSKAAFEQHASESRRVLSHRVTYELVESVGLPIVPQRLVFNSAEAVEFAKQIGFPVVAKIVNSEAAVHKTELGAIYTDIARPEELVVAVNELSRLISERQLVEDGHSIPILVQKMVRPAFEMYLGATVPSGGYPPMVLVGAGGIYVEAVRDVARSIAPLNKEKALALIRQLKIYPLLTGFRGGPAFDIQALADSMVKLGNLIAAAQDYVNDIDLNPLLIQYEGKGVFIVDAVFTLGAKTRPSLK